MLDPVEVIESDEPDENPSDMLVVNVPVSVVLNVRFGVVSVIVPIDEGLLNIGAIVSIINVGIVNALDALPAVSVKVIVFPE